jgi:hypothetical protein
VFVVFGVRLKVVTSCEICFGSWISWEGKQKGRDVGHVLYIAQKEQKFEIEVVRLASDIEDFYDSFLV